MLLRPRRLLFGDLPLPLRFRCRRRRGVLLSARLRGGLLGDLPLLVRLRGSLGRRLLLSALLRGGLLGDLPLLVRLRGRRRRRVLLSARLGGGLLGGAALRLRFSRLSRGDSRLLGRHAAQVQCDAADHGRDRRQNQSRDQPDARALRDATVGGRDLPRVADRARLFLLALPAPRLGLGRLGRLSRATAGEISPVGRVELGGDVRPLVERAGVGEPLAAMGEPRRVAPIGVPFAHRPLDRLQRRQ